MKSKNRKLIDTFLILIGIGIFHVTIADYDDEKLGEPQGFPGDSAFYESMEGSSIDNYANVYNYEYTTKVNTKSRRKNVHLKDLEFSFCENIDIPGMPDTKKEDFLNQYIFSTSQCPQGICFTEDFVFITSYSNEDDCLGGLLVFDREKGEYLITLGLDEDSHLGGIAYDGVNVWVCNSENKSIERISYEFIYLMAMQNKGKVINATNLVDVYPVKNVPSCITYYDGCLWIATHNTWMNSKMVSYDYNKEEDKLQTRASYNIPAQVQGIVFDETGEIYLSCSYGRRWSSYIKKYDSVSYMTEKVNHPAVVIEMPPGAEEIDIYEDTLYVLFESAGEKYYEGTDGNGKSLSPLDKILMIPIKQE